MLPRFKSSRPDLIVGKSPSATHAEGLFCFNSSIPASSPGVAPSSKSCRLARVFFGQRCNCLPIDAEHLWRAATALVQADSTADYAAKHVAEIKRITDEAGDRLELMLHTFRHKRPRQNDGHRQDNAGGVDIKGERGSQFAGRGIELSVEGGRLFACPKKTQSRREGHQDDTPADACRYCSVPNSASRL